MQYYRFIYTNIHAVIRPIRWQRHCVYNRTDTMTSKTSDLGWFEISEPDDLQGFSYSRVKQNGAENKKRPLSYISVPGKPC